MQYLMLASSHSPLLFRDNGMAINPLQQSLSPNLRQILYNAREKKYMIDGDENKFVVVV